MKNNKKYDVAILGWWHNSNYGSMLTYYALKKAIENLDYSTLMVNESMGYPNRHKLPNDAPGMTFARRQNYAYTEQEHFLENEKYNELADTFVVGSDQLWNPYIGRINDDLFLNFTADDKKRIAYGTSIGNFSRPKFSSEHFGEDFEQVERQNLSRFDWVSMRESDGISYFKENLGIDAPQVVDPVFLIDPKEYWKLADEATINFEEEYMLAFILDPDEDKKRNIEAVADKLGFNKIVVFTDANGPRINYARSIFNSERYEVIDDIRPENFLYAYKNAEYVVTDSFHGSCFSYIAQKPFSVFYNTIRGANRFASLMTLFKLGDTRRIYPENTAEDINANINVSKVIDFTDGNANLKIEREKSYNWLEKALSVDKATDKILPGATMERNFDNLKSVKLSLRNVLLTNKFVFYRQGQHGETLRQDVGFNADGTLSGTNPINEKSWKLEENRLIFYGESNQETTVWDNLNEGYRADDFRIVGEFIPNKAVHHVLESVPAAIKRDNSNPDFYKTKILLSRLKAYGIKHVVMAPGGRDVVLVRAFENHRDFFDIHYVIDERSAGYYALGLANKTKEPVVIMVTSGTAVSNLAPAVTEAYYMDLPLIVITADRYPEFHEIGEDQTIEQANIFEPMIKKSVNLPVTKEGRTDWYTNRLISEAILEARHNGTGPIHINLSFDILPNMAPIHASYELPRMKHVLRVTKQDSLARWEDYVQTLLKTRKILLVYGQDYKPTNTQKANIEKFASRYNVVILADWLSNIQGDKVVYPFNTLQRMTQRQFNEKLLPDIVLSVGGKNVMNHPINFKLRGAPMSVRHWRVAADGKFKDLFFHLTSILETNPDWFFEYFSNKAENHINDEQYLNSWKEEVKKYPATIHENYNNHYATQQLMEKMPEGSLFHIGVGSAFMLTHSENTVPGKDLEVFLNMGTNGIDGSASAYMGQVAADTSERLKFLLIGDVSFFYDMNSLWNKKLKKNIRIMMVNNSGSQLLRHYEAKGSAAPHNTVAEGWVKSLGFDYIASHDKEGFDEGLKRFTSNDEGPIFFEVFL